MSIHPEPPYRTVAVLAGAVLPLGLLVAPSYADTTPPGTIVFVRDHNVWIADGAGQGQRQLTTGGTTSDPWRTPTESDTGVVVAHRGGIVYRMNQRGKVMNSFDPPDLVDTLGNRLSGRALEDTAISPDGTKIAYSYFKIWGGEKRWTTGFTSATRISDPDDDGMAFYAHPSWVTNTRVVVNAWYRNKAHLYDLAERDIPWFSESDYTPDPKELSDLQVSRDGAWTVGIRGDVGDTSVVVIRNAGDVLTKANPWKPVYGVTNPCDIGATDGDLTSPTLAPDSSTVAWAEPDGIYRASDLDCDSSTRVDIRLIAGGSEPFWSAAPQGHTPDVRRPLVSASRPRVTGIARVGKVLRARHGTWRPAATGYAYRWTRDRKPIAGATRIAYRVTRKDRGHRIAVVVRATRAGWLAASSSSTPVTVRR